MEPANAGILISPPAQGISNREILFQLLFSSDPPYGKNYHFWHNSTSISTKSELDRLS
jgi:hypothetical protein